MRIGVVTLFPEMFTAVADYGITGRACREGRVQLECWNPRDYATDRHRTVDDRPFGGGPGMLMKTAPLEAAISQARSAVSFSSGEQQEARQGEPARSQHAGHGESDPGQTARVIYLSPQGRRLDQAGVLELASRSGLVLVCGRYQGIDERVLENEIDEEWSIGDYVLSGGELAAMVLIDAITRYQPGALGHEGSAAQDSFASGLLDAPCYTRPQSYRDQDVPGVLLQGNHEQIRLWRLKQSLGRTWLKRPELLKEMALDGEQQRLLKEFISEYEALQ